jgi:uncharacterized protein YjbI with pentapeptide repeats
MNEKSDEPAKQSAKPDQSAAQDQPQYREVSQEELKQILAAHKKWLETKGKQGKRAYLGDANLQEANLWRANLQEADLGDANLEKADLWRANLQEADLMEANLEEANLLRADLRKANLRKANLRKANLFEVKAVTASQIKRATNWRLAFYSDDFLAELDLPADHNETVEKKLAEIEKEKTIMP